MSGVGDGVSAESASWSFGGDVADHFDSHVSKSVPLYNEGHTLVCELADFFVKDGVTYEIGCSTGTLIRKVAAQCAGKKSARFVGVDIEQGMIDFAQQAGPHDSRVSYVADDVLQMEFEPADMILAYYTVQFVRPSERQRLIDKLYNSLKWGGALVMFEKTRGPDGRFQDILTRLYDDYKLSRGYSPEEIVSKARSLKGVLEPFSTRGNVEQLERAGFKDIMTIMKYIAFEGFVAIK